MAYITNLPINGNFNVSAFFGQTGSYWKNGHKGIDVVGESTIYSVCDGTVTYAGYDTGWGYYVSVMPNGFERVRFILCHLVTGSIKVKKGDKVTRTTVLGKMGQTGNATGVHTHIECRIDNTAVDPTPYLKIKNEKASNLNSANYRTTVEESNALIQKMIDTFDGKTDNEYKILYESEKAKNRELSEKSAVYEDKFNEIMKVINL